MALVQMSSEMGRKLMNAMANGVTPQDVAAVLDSYLGGVTYGEVYVADNPMAATIRFCFKSADGDGSLDDFVGCMIQRKWTESIRNTLLTGAPAFVRPDAYDFVGAVARLAGRIAGLVALLKDPMVAYDVIRTISPQRGPVGAMAKALIQLDGSKALHDALHTLQIKAAEWLELTAEAPAAGLDLFRLEIERAAQGIRDALPRLIDMDTAEPLRAAGILEDAAHRLDPAQTPTGDAIAFTRDTVRMVVASETPRADAVMFQLCKEMPIRSLRDAIDTANGDWGKELRDLSDALRRRVLAHGLWQEIDGEIHEIENLLAIPPIDFVPRLYDCWTAIGASLRLLADPDQDPIFEAVRGMNFALTSFDNALPPNGQSDAGPAREARDKLAVAFAEFAAAGRLRFYGVDTALRGNCAQLQQLSQPLQSLFKAIPRFYP